MYTNACSISNKKHEFYQYVDKFKPHIIGITEVWDKNDFGLDGYHPPIRKDRPADTKGGGVMILLQDNLKLVECEELNDSNFEESVWCSVQTSSKKKLLIGNCYRSPQSNHNNNANLNTLLETAKGMNISHTLIMGDFNFKEIDWKKGTVQGPENSDARLFYDSVQESLLCQHVDFPTRYRVGNTPSVLDLVFTKEENDIQELTCQPPLGKSDHCVLTWEMYLQDGLQTVNAGKPTLNYKAGNYRGITEALLQVNWDEMDDLDVEKSWCWFKSKIKEAIELFIPRFKTTRKVKNAPPWWNRTLEQQVKAKYRAWRTYKATGQGLQNYKRVRNETVNLIRNTRRQFETKLAKTAKKNPKAIAKYIRSQSKIKDRVTNLLKDDGSTTNSDREVAETLQEFFCSVFVREVPGSLPPFQDQLQPDQELRNITVTTEEIKHELDKLDGEKASGPDGIPSLVLKSCSEALTLPLSKIFAQSLDEGKLPSEWKKATVTPIFKKGSRKKAENYRPISLTSQCCKVFERMVKKRLEEHLTSHNLLTDHQHGFMRKRSCLTNLFETLENWTEVLDKNSCLDVIFLDYQKAFDSVPHLRLVKKLSGYGIKGKVLSWIRDFLVGRQQQVSVRSASSKWQEVRSGVPQGSVLGPILFNLYVNELPSLVTSKIKLFADDSKLYQSINNPGDCLTLQSDLNTLSQWSDDWLLRFNPNKCKTMHLGQHNPENTYYMQGVALNKTSSERDLGIIVTNTLKSTEHCQKAAKKGMAALRTLKSAFDGFTVDNFTGIFNTYVRPHLDYCIQAVGPLLVQDLNALERIQRRGTKMVSGLKQMSYDERLKVLKTMSIKDRIERGDLIEAYKIMTGKVNIRKEQFFEVKTTRTRGHHLKLVKKRAIHQSRLGFFSNRVVNKWNLLPSHVISANTTNTFKTRLDKHLKSLS